MFLLVCEINANFIYLQDLSPRTVGGHLLQWVGHINCNSTWAKVLKWPACAYSSMQVTQQSKFIDLFRKSVILKPKKYEEL